MKTLLLILVAGVFTTAKTFAQKETSIARPSLSIGIEGAMPLGDFKEGYNFGIGGTVKGALPVANDLDITLTAGYITFAGKTFPRFGKLPALNTIPIKAGVRYRLAGGAYFEPQLGYTILSAKDAESTGAFTYAGNIGYIISPALDLGIRYEALTKSGATNSFLGARLAYNFSL